ncbi:unnamed protein product [[Candida] boidinii]|nr:unnamed protein product [[Candida] boidinii]
MDKHLVKEQWIGRCQGDELITGAFTVNTGGLYAFVFDNTFSRTKGKKIMFNQYIESFEDDTDSIITNSNTNTNNNQDLILDTQQRKRNSSDIPTPSPVISTSSNTGGANIDNMTTSSLTPNIKNNTIGLKDIQNPTPLSYSSLNGSTPVSSAATPEPFSPYTSQSHSNSNTSLKNNPVRSSSSTTVTSNIPPPIAKHAPPPQSSSLSSSIPQSTHNRRSLDISNNVKFQLPNDTTISSSNSKLSRHNKKKNISSASTVLRAKGGQYLQGFLLKKKRRKSGGKNYVKRFFVLNFKYGVLDYYFDDNSNHIRGNMYIKNVIISANPNEMMIFLDSGIEQWILKAFSKKDFDYWVQAFNFIKKQSFNNIQQDSLQHTNLFQKFQQLQE